MSVKPVEPVTALAEQINKVLYPAFSQENRFHPHLTIARIKSIADKDKFLKIVHKTEIEPKKFRVESFELVQSVLHGGKPPVYATIKKFPLK